MYIEPLNPELKIPTEFIISAEYIISAFANSMDWKKVEEYADRLIEEDIFNECPPILGFPRVLDEDDIGTPFIRDLESDDEEKRVDRSMIGKVIWVVTDGHHRTFAFRRAYCRTKLHVFLHINAELDESNVTCQEVQSIIRNQQK